MLSAAPKRLVRCELRCGKENQKKHTDACGGGSDVACVTCVTERV